jgi:hypothetical protein
LVTAVNGSGQESAYSNFFPAMKRREKELAPIFAGSI